MSKGHSYPQYKQLNLPSIEKDVLGFWNENASYEDLA